MSNNITRILCKAWMGSGMQFCLKKYLAGINNIND